MFGADFPDDFIACTDQLDSMGPDTYSALSIFLGTLFGFGDNASVYVHSQFCFLNTILSYVT